MPSLFAVNLEELLTAQDAHEASASKDFVRMCQSAKTLFTDRVTSRKERIDELTGAIESYSERVDELKQKAKAHGTQPFDASGQQEQRVQLIRTESEHWRSVHAKTATEYLIEADEELLSGLDKILLWQEQAVSQHQASRKQLIAMVRDGRLDEAMSHTSPAVAVTTSEVPAIQSPTQMPPAPLSKPVQQPPLPSTKSIFPVMEQTSEAERPHPSVVRANSAAVLQVPPELAPIFGVTQLPALQLMQDDNPKLQVVPQSAAPPAAPQKSASELLTPMSTEAALPDSPVPSPLLSLAGMSSGTTFQAASAIKDISSSLKDTATLSAAPPAPTVAPQAMEAHDGRIAELEAKIAEQSNTIEAKSSKEEELQSKLEALATRESKLEGVQATRETKLEAQLAKQSKDLQALSGENKALEKKLAEQSNLVEDHAVEKFVEDHAVEGKVVAPVAPKLSPVVTPTHKPEPAAVLQPSQEAATAIPQAIGSQSKHESNAQSVPLATTLGAAVEKAIPMPAPVVQPPTKSNSIPAQKSSLVQSATDSSSQDQEDALMAIMTGSDSDSTSLSSDESNTASAVNIPTPVTAKPSAAFLSIKSSSPPVPARHSPTRATRKAAAPIKAHTSQAATLEDKPLPTAAPPFSAAEDPEDALMQVMLSGGVVTTQAPLEAVASIPTENHKTSSPDVKPQVRKRPAPVLAQTAQQVHSTSIKKRTQTKQAAVVHQTPAPDSAAGVMKSFVQEVSDLAQGDEPGDAQTDPAEPVKQQQQQEKQESEASMMNSFVQEVTALAQGEPTPQDSKPSSKPTTAAGLALSSDLASLMGLSDSSPPPSFLQITSSGRQNRASSRSELAAAALIKDLDSSEVSKRLARTVEKSSVDSNIAMLSALREQLEGYQFKWSCSRGPAVARTNAVLQLAETGTSLLMQERSTVAALSAELRDAQTTSAQLQAEIVAYLEQTIGQGLQEANEDLQSVKLTPLRNASPSAASALVALENTLRSDSAAAKRLAAQWVDKGSSYVKAASDLLQTSTAKDGELKQAQRVLSDARGRAASGRDGIAKEPGCSEAVHTSSLIAAVYRALDILQF